MVSHSQLKRQFLIEGLHDDIGLWAILWEFQDLPNDAVRRRETMALVEEFLINRWFEAGFPTSDGRGFNSWPSTPDVSVARINAEWDDLGREPNIGEIVWFHLTAIGEAEARRHVARKVLR